VIKIKGQALVWGGILTMCLLVTIFVYYMVGQEDQYKVVTITESKIISLANDALLIDKMYDQGIPYMAQRAAYDWAKRGGGYTVWTSSLSVDNLKTSLADKIKEETNFNAQYEITGDVSVTNQDADSFRIESAKEISVDSFELGSEFKITKNINQEISSSYFRLIQIGLDFFDPAKDYDPIINSGDTMQIIMTSLQQKLQTNNPGLIISVYTTYYPNQLGITIIDQNCKVFRTQEEIANGQSMYGDLALTFSINIPIPAA
jgi:hypothetical protein